MSWKNLRYKWYGVRWSLVREDTTDAKLRGIVNRALEEKGAVLLYTAEWMNKHHNGLAKDREIASSSEPADTDTNE
jgi:hypothetical protein